MAEYLGRWGRVGTSLATIAWVGAGIAGLVQGWQKADTAIKDQEALVKERDMYKNVVNYAEHKGKVQAEPALAVGSPA
jgi:hypothetical protein